MPVSGFSHYNLRAPRELLDALRDFYVEIVGLTPGQRPPFRSFGYWLYAGGEPVLHLSQAGNEEDRPATPHGTFDHAAFNCSDQPAFEALLTRRGIPYRVAEVPLTDQVQLFFADPAGNGVELNFSANGGH